MQYGCALGRICFDLLTIRLYQYFACSANNIMSTIVQYVVVRGDLLKLQKWPVGALIAQACHASSAAIHLFYEAEDTKQYLSDLDRMHKVVLEAQDAGSLSELATTLTASEIDHKLWVEQPENYPTCLATRPYPKQTVQQYFKKFKLFK